MLPDHIRDLWGHEGPYHDYTRWSRARYGRRVQKISLNQNGTCPNRDGTLGTGGCAFCRVDAFTPAYCFEGGDLAAQFAAGIAFFRAKYPDQGYFAYLQSYSNTYCHGEVLGQTLETLSKIEGCSGIIVATRPDLVGPGHASILGDWSERLPLVVELGIESTLDRSLKLMNRGHDFAAVQKACYLLAREGVLLGGHIILGLPGESAEDLPGHAERLNNLPIGLLKIHHLQVLQGTPWASRWRSEPDFFPSLNPAGYVGLCADFLEMLRPDLAIERFANESPRELVLFPRWDGVKNFELAAMVSRELQDRSSFQGQKWLAGGLW